MNTDKTKAQIPVFSDRRSSAFIGGLNSSSLRLGVSAVKNLAGKPRNARIAMKE